ncbi:hypothetical protein C7T94_16325 [Pedobacter yulinensis]|uniref:HTH araC/xylS-type domain-containing protein n=1 Tax=Pedobacter yulinensis TaxID=2126353 RepID=A0A2T3HIS5_9SPHI|nr:helix-turn-helix domain-containing protein [Pedobacter yulinensis]PST82346.1 hypothetical protein C7T94_16325 [Pedobacter yulinensis]
MEFSLIHPSDPLKPYVKHYFLFVSASDQAFNDTVFPSGDMEAIFNLGTGSWERMVDGRFEKTPPTELWGQITSPLSIRSSGRHVMLGIRFFTHSASYFFKEDLAAFNNQVTDLGAVLGKRVAILHSQLLETPEISGRIELVEAYLMERLRRQQQIAHRADKVAHILSSIRQDVTESNMTRIATRHGITTRYLQRLLQQHTGLSPKSFDKINRFQKSLSLLGVPGHSLTEVAYRCGYFDQSHFIRDFKAFTGITPTAYLQNITLMNQLLIQ